jgi:hypothetical protein
MSKGDWIGLILYSFFCGAIGGLFPSAIVELWKQRRTNRELRAERAADVAKWDAIQREMPIRHEIRRQEHQEELQRIIAEAERKCRESEGGK